MLDYRLKTFLLLGKTLNYTKTAELLHLSQPAVSQHIHYLEQRYGFKFFEYRNRKLQLTDLGSRLYQKAAALDNESRGIIKDLTDRRSSRRVVRFDSTATFGEYILPPLFARWLKNGESIELCTRIKNTRDCLETLNQGETDFALIEGFFNKAHYEYRLVKQTHMGLVVHPEHPLCQKEHVYLNDLIQYPLIVRQKESRERGILPTGLAEHNYSYDSFHDLVQCGSMNVMKILIQSGCGIGFLHEDVIREEVKQGKLKEILVEDFVLSREMNMVYLPNPKDPELLDWVYHDLMEQIRLNEEA